MSSDDESPFRYKKDHSTISGRRISIRSNSGKIYGPFSRAEVLDLIKMRKLDGEEKMIMEGSLQWSEISSDPEFFDAFHAQLERKEGLPRADASVLTWKENSPKKAAQDKSKSAHPRKKRKPRPEAKTQITKDDGFSNLFGDEDENLSDSIKEVTQYSSQKEYEESRSRKQKKNTNVVFVDEEKESSEENRTDLPPTSGAATLRLKRTVAPIAAAVGAAQQVSKWTVRATKRIPSYLVKNKKQSMIVPALLSTAGILLFLSLKSGPKRIEIAATELSHRYFAALDSELNAWKNRDIPEIPSEIESDDKPLRQGRHARHWLRSLNYQLHPDIVSLESSKRSYWLQLAWDLKAVGEVLNFKNSAEAAALLEESTRILDTLDSRQALEAKSKAKFLAGAAEGREEKSAPITEIDPYDAQDWLNYAHQSRVQSTGMGLDTEMNFQCGLLVLSLAPRVVQAQYWRQLAAYKESMGEGALAKLALQNAEILDGASELKERESLWTDLGHKGLDAVEILPKWIASEKSGAMGQPTMARLEVLGNYIEGKSGLLQLVIFEKIAREEYEDADRFLARLKREKEIGPEILGLQSWLEIERGQLFEDVDSFTEQTQRIPERSKYLLPALVLYKKSAQASALIGELKKAESKDSWIGYWEARNAKAVSNFADCEVIAGRTANSSKGPIAREARRTHLECVDLLRGHSTEVLGLQAALELDNKEKDYRAIVEASPWNARAQFSLAKVLESKGSKEEALAHYRRAASSGNLSLNANLHAALLAIELERPEEVSLLSTKHFMEHPGAAGSFDKIAEYFNRISLFERTVELSKLLNDGALNQSSSALLSVAEAYLALDDHEIALNWVERAKVLAPENPKLLQLEGALRSDE